MFVETACATIYSKINLNANPVPSRSKNIAETDVHPEPFLTIAFLILNKGCQSNVWPNRLCNRWKRRGFCQGRFANFMKTNCCKACATGKKIYFETENKTSSHFYNKIAKPSF